MFVGEGAEKLAIPVDFGVCGGGGGVEVVDWRQYTTPFRRRPMHNLLRTEIYENNQWIPVHGLAKEWSLGCVITASWSPLCGAHITQPRDHPLAVPCTGLLA